MKKRLKTLLSTGRERVQATNPDAAVAATQLQLQASSTQTHQHCGLLSRLGECTPPEGTASGDGEFRYMTERTHDEVAQYVDTLDAWLLQRMNERKVSYKARCVGVGHAQVHTKACLLSGKLIRGKMFFYLQTHINRRHRTQTVAWGMLFWSVDCHLSNIIPTHTGLNGNVSLRDVR